MDGESGEKKILKCDVNAKETDERGVDDMNRVITAQCTLSWDRMSSVRLSVCDVGDL